MVCKHLIVGTALAALCLAGWFSPASAQISNANVTGIFSVRNYGATGNGTTDDTAAFNSAITACESVHGELYIPYGTYKISSSLVVNGCDVAGEGAGSVLKASGLASGTSCLVIQNTTYGNVLPLVRNLNLSGPGMHTLGVKTAGCEGLEVECAAHVDDIRVTGFDYGVVWDSPAGHISMLRCYCTDNYYGVYCYLDDSDYLIDDCNLDGNDMASLGTAYNQGFASMTLRDTHLGFSPYGIYQEGGTLTGSVVFMQDCILERARFEAIGNGAMYSANVKNGAYRCQYDAVTITYPGMAWSSTYALSGVTNKYAVVCDLALRVNSVWNGATGFSKPSGGLGVYGFVQNSSTSFFIDGVNTPTLP